MPYYVYIIRSESRDSYYKGFSENPVRRLGQHNSGETKSTRNGIPWKLVYVEEMNTKTDALKREKNLKKATLERIEALICHTKNIRDQFEPKKINATQEH